MPLLSRTVHEAPDEYTGLCHARESAYISGIWFRLEGRGEKELTAEEKADVTGLNVWFGG
jgi:hypothetical protein